MVKTRILALSALVLGLSGSLHAAPQKTEAVKLFGYNPNITTIAPVQPGDQKIALLCLHGFGCQRGESYKRYFPGNEHYVPVTFDFKDTLFFKNKSWNLEKLRGARSINVGQTPDAEVALYALVQTWKAGYQSIIFGHSRGGATAITMLHMMTFPETYLKTWERLGFTKKVMVPGLLWNGTKTVIDTEKLTALKNSVKKIFIEKPLLDINDILNKDIQGTADSFTAFKKHTQQPRELLESLVDKNLQIHFTLAQQDNVVTNYSDTKLSELALKAGWSIVKVQEEHTAINTTIGMVESYINQIFPAPQSCCVVAQGCTRCRSCRSCRG